MSRVYVWEFPVRLAHWLLVLSIVTLSITGFYIGAPFLYGDADTLMMAYMRFVHFVAAFLFTVCSATSTARGGRSTRRESP